MDEVVGQILSYKTAILMIAITIGTFFIRRIVETAFPKVKQAAPETAHAVSYTNQWAVWWNQVILYGIPVVLGMIGALTTKDLITLDGFVSKSGLAMYGGVCGWLSGFGYKVFRKMVKAKTGVDLPSPEVEVTVETKNGESKVEVKIDGKVEPKPEEKPEDPKPSGGEAA